MAKVACLVHAGTESPSDQGRITNALQTAAECYDAGDDVTVILDGAAVQWVAELESEDNHRHPLYRKLSSTIEVCEFCAGAFGVDEEIDRSRVESVGEYEGHPSIRQLAVDGYEIISF